jgi:deferrochelatase/peroxidase EfeB
VNARPSRREILGGAGALAVAGAAFAVAGCGAESSPKTAPALAANDVLPFYGAHQSGIVTPPQQRLFFASLDLLTDDRDALRTLMQRWTTAAPRLTAGLPVGPVEPVNDAAAPADTGEATDLPPSRLTITVGLGRSVFVDGRGRDRLGLAHQLPAPLVEIPAFGGGENLDPARSHGDIALQCCAEDATVAFHAFRNLARIGRDVVSVRWTQLGFGRAASTGVQTTPRNLQGFKDGTNNLDSTDDALMRDEVWVGPSDGPAWMTGGTYMVTRRIRMRLEHWDRSSLADQEATIGRTKLSGAPLGGANEHDTPALHAEGPDGQLVIAKDAHIRLAAPDENGRLKILRRGYSFSDGIEASTGQLDAGLFFIAFQRDPRTQFIPLQQRLAARDALNEYIEHVAGAAFAVLPGVQEGEYLAQHLFT